MIAQIRGTLISSSFTEAVVDVGGVGYRAFIPMSTFDTLPQPGGEVTLLTHMHVREDAIILFGFATRQEQAAFELLITVNGIGAKTALNIMSCMNITSLCAAIAGGDIKTLKRISGVGPKSAERMIVELRDKVDAIVHDWGDIQVVLGAYGPYVKGPGRYNNVKIPEGTDPQQLTREEAEK